MGIADLTPNGEAEVEATTHYPNIGKSTRATQRRVSYVIQNQAMSAPGANGLLDDRPRYKKAGGPPDHQKLRQAIEEKIQTINQKSVSTLSTIPAGSKPIATRWVHQVKNKLNRFIERYKSRLVEKGFSQKPGTYFGEIYALVIKYTTL